MRASLSSAKMYMTLLQGRMCSFWYEGTASLVEKNLSFRLHRLHHFLIGYSIIVCLKPPLQEIQAIFRYVMSLSQSELFWVKLIQIWTHFCHMTYAISLYICTIYVIEFRIALLLLHLLTITANDTKPACLSISDLETLNHYLPCFWGAERDICQSW